MDPAQNQVGRGRKRRNERLAQMAEFLIGIHNPHRSQQTDGLTNRQGIMNEERAVVMSERAEGTSLHAEGAEVQRGPLLVIAMG